MDLERSPDPVAAPAAYQQFLLEIAGDDDPAEVQAATPTILRQIVVEAGDDLATSPEPGEWSVYGCIAHVMDAEIVSSGRYRWILAHDEPPLLGYDQDAWVGHLHPGDEPVGDLLAVFEALRVANVALWRRTAPELRSRVGIHAERGPESFDLSFRLIAGHDRFHEAQAHGVLQAVRGLA